MTEPSPPPRLPVVGDEIEYVVAWRGAHEPQSGISATVIAVLLPGAGEELPRCAIKTHGIVLQQAIPYGDAYGCWRWPTAGKEE